MTTAAKIAKALGVAQLSGRWWRAVCPVHGSRTGRSMTLALRDGDRGLIVVCHAGCAPAEILAELRRRGLLYDLAASARSVPPAPQPRNDDASRIAAARQLWDATRDALGSPVVRYLAGRAIHLPPPSSLRWAPRCWHREARAHQPAMVALVEHVARGVVGAHRTYLRRDDNGIWCRRDRASLGPIGGGAVRLAPAAETLMVAEGIETAMAGMQATGQPAWAALSTAGMVALELPREVRHVLILADHDPNGAGERAAHDAAQRWLGEGRRVRVALPPEPGTDMADVLTGRAYAELQHA